MVRRLCAGFARERVGGSNIRRRISRADEERFAAGERAGGKNLLRLVAANRRGVAFVMAETRLSIRLDLTSGDRIGPGKVALLEAIRDSGSISAGARQVGMSYHRAWLLVEEINAALEEPAVT